MVSVQRSVGKFGTNFTLHLLSLLDRILALCDSPTCRISRRSLSSERCWSRRRSLCQALCDGDGCVDLLSPFSLSEEWTSICLGNILLSQPLGDIRLLSLGTIRSRQWGFHFMGNLLDDSPKEHAFGSPFRRVRHGRIDWLHSLHLTSATNGATETLQDVTIHSSRRPACCDLSSRDESNLPSSSWSNWGFEQSVLGAWALQHLWRFSTTVVCATIQTATCVPSHRLSRSFFRNL